MLPKQVVLAEIEKVIKDRILPDLVSSAAKEQAAALLAVLKNLDLNTRDAREPFRMVNNHTLQFLQQLPEQLLLSQELESTALRRWLEDLPGQLSRVPYEDSVASYHCLNELLCQFIELLYLEEGGSDRKIKDDWIRSVRSLLRTQLDVELKYIR
jgi:hypothetical protein